MPVKLRKRKDRISRITPVAIEAFRRMELARHYGENEEWWAAHNMLHDELGLPPWEWPCFEYPDAQCPYPTGCWAAEHWHKTRAERPEAFALYKTLRTLARKSSRACSRAWAKGR